MSITLEGEPGVTRLSSSDWKAGNAGLVLVLGDHSVAGASDGYLLEIADMRAIGSTGALDQLRTLAVHYMILDI